MFSRDKSHQKVEKNNPSAVSRAGYKQYWLKHKLEIRKGKGGFEERMEMQTTRREFIDLPGTVGLGGKRVVTLEGGLKNTSGKAQYRREINATSPC